MSATRSSSQFTTKRARASCNGAAALASGTAESVSTAAGGRLEAQPFLKWAGGKAQLLRQFEPFFAASVSSYREPFVGGGAVFFHLKARFPKMRAVLHDNNAELINCYQEVRDHCDELMRRLDEHLKMFRGDGERYYYLVRSQHALPEPGERAARMIFLNKTC